MPILTLNDIHYTYPDASTAVLKGTTASFPVGWTGIVGDNGCGKSTLARIATRLLAPDSGAITPSLSGAYCEQATEHEPAFLQEFAYDYSSEAMRLRALLEVEDEWLWRYGTLSCGQQKRIQVAVSLWSDPEVLAVDEPTNHVDTQTRMQIITALRAYRGIGLLISHDRELLDTLLCQSLCFENGTTIMRPGNYSEGKAQAEIEKRTASNERKQIQAGISHLEAERQRRTQVADRTAARRSGRKLAKHDNDGREKLRLAVVSGQDGKAGALSTQMDSRLSAAARKLESVRVEKRYDGAIGVDAKPAQRKTLLRIEENGIPWGDHGCLWHPALYIGNTDHIGIAGANGSGKSTLVRHIMTLLSDDIEMLYIPQEIDEARGRDILAGIKTLDSTKLGRLLSVVAQLNSSPKRILDGETVSPGELRKLMLACGLLKNPVLIVMDEPTNHLDIHSIEALESALAHFPGALLLVSHDRRFLESTTDLRWNMEKVLKPTDETGSIASILSVW